MSAPETDPFYDALRNRLHDYEEPLPAGGWAGIAQKLPPPKPWWRRRPPRRLLLLMLLLLLVPAALVWHWQAQRSRAAQAPSLASAPAAPAATGAAPNRATAGAPAAGTAADPAVAAQATTRGQATTSDDVAAPEATAGTDASAPGSNPAAPASRAVPGRTIKIKTLGHVQHLPPGTVGGLPTDSTNTAAASDTKSAQLATARRRQRQRQLLLVVAAARRRPVRSHLQTQPTDAPAAHPAAPRPAASAQPAELATQPAAQSASQSTAPPTGQPATSEATPNPTSAGTGVASSGAPAGVSPPPPGSSAVLGANEPATSTGLLGATTRKRTPKPSRSRQSAEQAPADPATRLPADAASIAAANEAADLTRLRANESVLGSLTSSLLMPPGAVLPTPLPPPAGPRDSLRRLRPARLSLGLLLGTMLPPQALLVRPDSSGRTLPLRRLPGASAELAARYRLSPSLALRSGVGYSLHRQEASVTVEKRQAYWGRSTQLIVTNGPTGPDTLRVVSYGLLDSVVSRQRQRYQLSQQYLTLPLAAEWHPRTPFVRWQPVLGFGATASWLLRGSYLRSDDGCHCEEKTQRGGANGPFAPVSVALTASLGLDYALGLRSVLLVRPAATYSLTSPARNGGRGTFSAGLQVGWLFDAHRP